MALRRLHINPQQGIALLVSIALVGLVSLVIHVTGGTVPYPDERYPFDHYKYIAMSQAPFSDEPLVHVAPFAWRVLTPFLVFLMPFNFKLGFHIVTTASLVVAAFFAYLYLRKLRFGHWYALTGLFLFMLLPDAFRLNLWDYFLIDPLALAFVAIGFYLMETRRDRLFALCVWIGVLNKEVVLFLVPAYTVFALRHYGFTRQFLVNVFIVAAPAVFIYLSLRAFIPVYNEYSFLDRVELVLQLRFADKGIIGVLRQLGGYSTGAWGILVPLALLNPRQKVSWLMRRPEWIVFFLLAYSQMLISHDIGRLVVYAFPVVIPLAVQGLRSLYSTVERSQFWILMGFLIPLHIIFALHDDIGSPIRFISVVTAITWPLLEVLRLRSYKKDIKRAGVLA